MIAAIAERFGGRAFVFDVMPRWLSERSADGFATAGGYRRTAMALGVRLQ